MSPRRRYVLINFLTWLPTGLYAAAMVLLMLDRGLSLPTIAAMGFVYSITVVLVELPTGGLADVIGRKPVLIASTIASMAALALMGLSTTVALFAVAAMLRGFARALGTGPAEAWYVDTVHATEGEDADLAPGLAKGSMAGSIGLTVGTVASGLIPIALVGLLDVPLAVPMLLAAGVELVRLAVIVFAMPEPRRARGPVLESVPGNIREAARIVRHDGVLARLLMVAGGVGVALAGIELLTPAWLAKVTGAFETAGLAYASVAALGYAASAVGAGLSARVVRWAGGPGRAGMFGLLVMAFALAGLASTTLLTGLAGIIGAAVAYFVIFAGLGTAGPANATMLHGRTNSAQRTTVVSMQSLALQLSGTAGALVCAWVSTQVGPAAAFALAASVIVAASMLALRAGVLSSRPIDEMSVSFAKLSR